MVGQGGVHVVDVGLVMLVVVQLHGLRVDERFQGGVVVRQRCKFISHWEISSELCCWGRLLRFLGKERRRQRTKRNVYMSLQDPVLGWMRQMGCGIRR